MRQRLSSEPDRYRGRRRVPTPPRSRYAVVVTSAFVGAGVVALGAASNLPDAKDVNPDGAAEPRELDAAADAPRRPRQRHRTRLPWRRPRRRQPGQDQRRGGRGRRLAAAARGLHVHLPVRGPLGQAARRHRPGRPRGHAVQGGARRHGDPGRLQRRLRLLGHDPGRRRHRGHLRPLPPAAGARSATRSRPARCSARSAAPAPRTAPTCTSRCTSSGSRPTRSPTCGTRGVDIKLQVESVYAGMLRPPPPDRTAARLQLGWIFTAHGLRQLRSRTGPTSQVSVRFRVPGGVSRVPGQPPCRSAPPARRGHRHAGHHRAPHSMLATERGRTVALGARARRRAADRRGRRGRHAATAEPPGRARAPPDAARHRARHRHGHRPPWHAAVPAPVHRPAHRRRSPRPSQPQAGARHA